MILLISDFFYTMANPEYLLSQQAMYAPSPAAFDFGKLKEECQRVHELLKKAFPDEIIHVPTILEEDGHELNGFLTDQDSCAKPAVSELVESEPVESEPYAGHATSNSSPDYLDSRRNSLDEYMDECDEEEKEALAVYNAWDGVSTESWNAITLPKYWCEFKPQSYKKYLKGPLFYRQWLIDELFLEPPTEVIAEALMVLEGAQIPEWWTKVQPPQYKAYTEGLDAYRKWLINQYWLEEKSSKP